MNIKELEKNLNYPLNQAEKTMLKCYKMYVTAEEAGLDPAIYLTEHLEGKTKEEAIALAK